MSRLSASALILFLSILFFSCGNNRDNQTKKVFNLNLEQGLTSLDPAFARNQFVMWMTNQLYNGLLQVNEKLEILPAIAKSWEI
ncbi:MAG TPA: ABC transporter substrate-binding protein, partial [Sphingobacteriaceae bacterium]